VSRDEMLPGSCREDAHAFLVVIALHDTAHPFVILVVTARKDLHMSERITTIARYALLEASRTRLPQLVLGTILLLGAAGFFVQSLGVIEGTRLQVGFYASTVRLAAVFIVGMYVLASVAREFNDKGLDIVLALDLPRSHYILGKLLGFLIIGTLVAASVSIPLAFLSTPAAALKWGLSLALELAIIMACGLFCIVTFSQLLSAASFLLAFYLLARVLTAIRLMSEHPLVGATTLSHRFIRLIVEAVALVMPAFDQWTRTAWLLELRPAWAEIGTLAWQTAIYVALLACATMFDFYRKNI